MGIKQYEWDAARRLTKLRKKSDGSLIASYDYDEKGRRTRYTGTATDPYYYPATVRDTATDFNRSSEHLGMFPYPITLTIISQRVRQLFLKYKVKRARFEPVILVDEN